MTLINHKDTYSIKYGKYGIIIVVYAIEDTGPGSSIERSANGVTGWSEVAVLPSVKRIGDHFVDLLPNDGVTRFYRAKHIWNVGEDGPYTNIVSGIPIFIDPNFDLESRPWPASVPLNVRVDIDGEGSGSLFIDGSSRSKSLRWATNIDESTLPDVDSGTIYNLDQGDAFEALGITTIVTGDILTNGQLLRAGVKFYQEASGSGRDLGTHYDLGRYVSGSVGQNAEFYYIKPLNGRTFKSTQAGETTPEELHFNIVAVDGSTLTNQASSSDYGLFYSSSDDAVTSEDPTTWKTLPADLNLQDTIELRSGSTVLDTIDVTDITDARDAPFSVLDVNGGIAWVSSSDGWDRTTPSYATASFYVGDDLRATEIVTVTLNQPSKSLSAAVTVDTGSVTTTITGNDSRAVTLRFESGSLVTSETFYVVADGADGNSAEFYYIKPLTGRTFKTTTAGVTTPSELQYNVIAVNGSILTNQVSSSVYGLFYSSSDDALTSVNAETWKSVPDDIDLQATIELRSGSTVLDTIDVTDITDARDAPFGVLEVNPGIAWVSSSDGWDRTTESYATASFYVGQDLKAVEIVTVTLDQPLRTISGAVTTDTGSVTTTITGNDSRAVSLKFESGSIIVSETFYVVADGYDGGDGAAGARGPGLLYIGEYSDLAGARNLNNNDDAVDVVSVSGTYYAWAGADQTTVTSAGSPPDANWTEFTSFDAVATDLLLAQDAFIGKTLNIGTNALGSSANITLVGDTTSPYLSIGQGSDGWDNDGIFLGKEGGAYVFSCKTGSSGISVDNEGNVVATSFTATGAGNIFTGSAFLEDITMILSAGGGTAIQIDCEDESNIDFKIGQAAGIGRVFADEFHGDGTNLTGVPGLSAGNGLALTGSTVSVDYSMAGIISDAPVGTGGNLVGSDFILAEVGSDGHVAAVTFEQIDVTLFDISSLPAGGVTSVGASLPISSSGGNTPTISIRAATTSLSGHMTSTQATKLSGIATGATENGTIDGSGTHTGTSSGTNSGDNPGVTAVNAGTGISIPSPSSPTVALNITGLTSAIPGGAAEFVFDEAGLKKRGAGTIPLSIFNNDEGWGPGSVVSVAATLPISSSGGDTPTISIRAATSGQTGHMTTAYAGKLDGIDANATDNGTIQGSGTHTGTSSGTNSGDNPGVTAVNAGTGISVPSPTSPTVALNITGLSSSVPGGAAEFVFDEAGLKKRGAGTIPLSIFNNDAGFGTGTVTSVGATSPVTSSGGTTPTISMLSATSGRHGYMTSTFAGKLDGVETGATDNGSIQGSGTHTGTSTGTNSGDNPGVTAVNAGTAISIPTPSSPTVSLTFSGVSTAVPGGAAEFLFDEAGIKKRGASTIPLSIFSNDITSGTNTGDNPGVTSVSGSAPVSVSVGTQPTVSMLSATSGRHGYMTSTFATKLNGIATGATENGTIDGSGTHTGTSSGTNSGDNPGVTAVNAGTGISIPTPSSPTVAVNITGLGSSIPGGAAEFMFDEAGLKKRGAGTIPLSIFNNDDNWNNYVHPSTAGDDISIDTGPLTGATVISDLDFNVTTNTLGHVTDANATISTRSITKSDIGLGNVANTAQVTSVGASLPLASSGGTSPSISIRAASASQTGYMTTAYASKLNGIATGATENGTIDGSGTHTGTSSGTNTGDNAGVTAVNAGTGISIPTPSSPTVAMNITGLSSAVPGGAAEFVFDEAGLKKRGASTIPLSIFSNNQGWTANGSVQGSGTTSGTNTGDNAGVTSVGGGTNLSSTGGTTPTINMNASITVTDVVATSDIRKKKVIGKLDGSLKIVNKMEAIRYTWKDNRDSREHIGLSAQDILKLVPEVVHEDETNGELGIAYSKLVPVLIEAIKELTKKVEDLENK